MLFIVGREVAAPGHATAARAGERDAVYRGGLLPLCLPGCVSPVGARLRCLSVWLSPAGARLRCLSVWLSPVGARLRCLFVWLSPVGARLRCLSLWLSPVGPCGCPSALAASLYICLSI